jgi:hypothetical protein
MFGPPDEKLKFDRVTIYVWPRNIMWKRVPG